MNVSGSPPFKGDKNRLLETLERLLGIRATETEAALNEASQLIAETLGADKVDAFLYDPAIDTLIAVGTSDTPMSRHEIATGLNRLPLSNGGRAAHVFRTGTSFRCGHVERDPEELPGIKEVLGIRSILAVVLEVVGERRGVLQVDSAQPERFTAEDLDFVEAAARWVGMVLDRAELTQRIAAEAAERARRLAADELITILAHDLRAPLTPLRGRIGMIRMRAEREGLPVYLDDVKAATRSVDRLERLIGDLMDSARLDRGVLAVDPQPVDLADLVRLTVETQRTPEAEIMVRGLAELWVEADPSRIRQALENLLSNARTYSPEAVPVSVDLRSEDRADGRWAVLSVRDTGPGIAPELLPQFFNRFVAGPHTTGLGLGLYLARGIVEAHGGTLTAESVPDHGASFTIALPVPESLRETLAI